MRAQPELLRGPVAADALLVRGFDGWVAKGGAEGLFCAASPDGLGIALKVEDGAFRAIRPALAAFLEAARDRPRGRSASWRSRTAAARSWARFVTES